MLALINTHCLGDDDAREISTPMLDVHAPHQSVHTSKDFFIHIATTLRYQETYQHGSARKALHNNAALPRRGGRLQIGAGL